MRLMTHFQCEGRHLAATLDEGTQQAGLLLVSGGNEIRSGAHAGQAALASHFAARGYSVFRYDRRGIGDSEGGNGGFESSAADIAAAVTAFRGLCPSMQRVVAFGNCDAATALALFHDGLAIDALLLANPWVIEAQSGDGQSSEDLATPPSAASIRARYWNRIKNPRSVIDLLTGKINLRKLLSGLVKASKADRPTGLAVRMAEALSTSSVPTRFLIADRDTTAMVFMASWNSDVFSGVRKRQDIVLSQCATASHSFADAQANHWLREHMESMLAGEFNNGQPNR